jgi:hypothetical protein
MLLIKAGLFIDAKSFQLKEIIFPAPPPVDCVPIFQT